MTSLCPDLAALDRWRDDPELVRHLDECTGCAATAELIEMRAEVVSQADCSRFEPLLAAWLDRKLPAADMRSLEDHIEACLDCATMVGTLGSGAGGLPEVERHAYQIDGEIDRGGMGRVVAARDLRIGRPVAIKELILKTPAMVARFEREARMTARLQHPSIIPIYEIGHWPDGTPFYVMRRVAGRTLRDVLVAAKGLEARLAALPTLIAAADAIAFAHGLRCIHRDLKPSNILVGEHGETVVIDWGLAKDLNADTPSNDLEDRLESLLGASAGLTTDGTVIGTPTYMPPEQAAGQRVDERADVYALGAILYELLAGEAPYGGAFIVEQVKQGPPRPAEAVEPRAPRDLASIAAKAMARAPAERYQNAGELAEELRRFQTGRLVHAHAYSQGDRFRRFVRRNRPAVVIIAAGLVTIAVLGAIAIAGRHEDELQRLTDVERAVCRGDRISSDGKTVKCGTRIMEVR